MKLKIKDLVGTDLGVLVVENNQVSTKEITSQVLRDFIGQAIKSDLPVLTESYDPDAKRFVTYQEEVPISDPHFDLALKSFLVTNGYDVEEDRPDLDNQLLKLLESQPDGDEKRKITEELPRMSYLQKSYLLKSLQDA